MPVNPKRLSEKIGIGVCDACFSGVYNGPVPKENFVDKFSKKIEITKQEV